MSPFDKKNYWKRLIGWSIGAVLLGNAIACSQLTSWQDNLTPDRFLLTDIEAIDAQKRDRQVVLAGMVKAHAPFINSGAYQLEDATGTIWIKSKRPLPKRGEKITIRGEVRSQKLIIDELVLEEVYVVELKQLSNSS